MARWILSFGIDCALAALTAARRRGFMSGSGVPIFAATVISRLSLEKAADRFLSCAPLRYMMFLYLEWPAIGSSISQSGRAYRSSLFSMTPRVEERTPPRQVRGEPTG